jgi:Zn-dependent protease
VPDVTQALAIVVGFTTAITVHECSHAATAYALGDNTARHFGRLTLNPAKHLDPLGSLLLLLVVFSGTPGIGWGKPVPVQPSNLRGERRGMAIVSAAGPVSNVVLAVITLSVESVLDLYNVSVPNWLTALLSSIVSVNIGLAAFNFLPLPPLDGFSLAIGLLPERAAVALASVERYGPGILLLLVFAPSIINIDLLSYAIRPLLSLVAAIVYFGAALATRVLTT